MKTQVYAKFECQKMVVGDEEELVCVPSGEVVYLSPDQVCAVKGELGAAYSFIHTTDGDVHAVTGDPYETAKMLCAAVERQNGVELEMLVGILEEDPTKLDYNSKEN